MTKRIECELCGNLMVPPDGPPGSKVLLIGEYPGHEEIMQGRPWVGMAGDILKTEMARAGLQFESFRVANLWQHAVPEKTADNKKDFKAVLEEEFNYHFRLLEPELQGKDHILLMGSEVVRVFMGGSVMGLAGLKVDSALMPPSVKTVMVAPNPALLIHDTIGEFRLSLEKFAKEIKQ